MQRIVLGLLCAVAVGGSVASAEPSRSLRDACSRDVVRVAPKRHVDVAVAVAGYGLCEDSDRYTGGERFYRLVDERWVDLGGSGGAYGEVDAAFVHGKYGVPVSVFRVLFREANSVLRAR